MGGPVSPAPFSRDFPPRHPAGERPGADLLFGDDDYAAYRELMAEQAGKAGVEVWSWVLMPNHVHLILVPKDEDGLRRMLAPLHLPSESVQ